MYPTVLFLHSWNRWLVLAAACFTLFRAWRGWLGARPFTGADNAGGSMLIGALHLQLLLGMWLYFGLSPLTHLAFQQMGEAWRNPTLRFWSVQHISLMLTGVVVAQVGRALSRRAQEAYQKHRLAALFYSAAVALILLGIPFATRPWFRG